jgi:hypothetical protein
LELAHDLCGILGHVDEATNMGFMGFGQMGPVQNMEKLKAIATGGLASRLRSAMPRLRSAPTANPLAHLEFPHQKSTKDMLILIPLDFYRF